MTQEPTRDGVRSPATNPGARQLALKRTAVWQSILLLAMLTVPASAVLGDTLQFTVDPANTGIVYQGGEFDLSSSGLNGTVLSGQSLSLQLALSNDVLARLFVSDPTAFGVELIIETNAPSDPGFAGTTTGSLLDASGNQLGATQVAGRAEATDGSFTIGLESFTSTDFGATGVVDISGAEFDTSLPDTGFDITGATLRFSLNSAADGIEFGTAQQLPEGASSLTLTLEALLGLAAAVRLGILTPHRL
jgi:hypothetical protein